MENCLFCKIISGEIPSTKVYEDEFVYAFNDIEPQAPHHIIIVPKIHIASANDINAENSKYIAHIFEIIPKIAKDLGFGGVGIMGAVWQNFDFHSSADFKKLIDYFKKIREAAN